MSSRVQLAENGCSVDLEPALNMNKLSGLTRQVNDKPNRRSHRLRFVLVKEVSSLTTYIESGYTDLGEAFSIQAAESNLGSMFNHRRGRDPGFCGPDARAAWPRVSAKSVMEYGP